jgi:hypothetical protein
MAFTGSTYAFRTLWTGHMLASRGFSLLLLPGLAALALAPLASYWVRCAPALLKGAFIATAEKVTLIISGYAIVLAILSLATAGFAVTQVIQLGFGAIFLGLAATSWAGYWQIDSVTQVVSNLKSHFEDSIPGRQVVIPGQATDFLTENAYPNSVPVKWDRQDQTGAVPFAAENSEPAHPANTTSLVPVLSVIDDENEWAGSMHNGQSVVPLARPKWTPQQAMDPATHAQMLERIAVEAPHLRPQVARNPAAASELLNWLGGLGDPDVNLALLERI